MLLSVKPPLLSARIFLIVPIFWFSWVSADQTLFHQTDFDVDFDITHNIIAGDFLDRPGRELLIAGVNVSGEKLMAIYGLDEKLEAYIPLSRKLLPENIVVFDTISDIENKYRVLLLSAEKLSILDFNHDAILPLEAVDSIYVNKRPQFIAQKPLVRDLNGDGLDDIAISGFKGLYLFLQQDDRKFIRNNLPVSPIVDMGNEQIAFAEKPVFSVDANNDNLIDLVVVSDGHLLVYAQSVDKGFSPHFTSVVLPVPARGLPWWYLRDANGNTADQSELQHMKVESVVDIDGDDVIDLLIMNTHSSGLLDRDNRYDVYYGRIESDKLSFESARSTGISSKGTLTGLSLNDIDFNKRKEILVLSFDIGLTQIIGALISGTIKQNVFLFALDENNRYNQQPNFSKTVGLSFSLTTGSTGQAVTLLADIDGDKMKDLILSQGDERLMIYSGVAETGLFRKKRLLYKVKLPKDGEMVIATNLSSQKLQDIIIRYGRQDVDALRRKVVVLSR